MREHLFAVSLIGMSALVGCAASQDQPASTQAQIPKYDPSNLGPWCGAAGILLGNPNLDTMQKLVIIEMMRNRGCMK
jgi:hypothetical protein